MRNRHPSPRALGRLGVVLALGAMMQTGCNALGSLTEAGGQRHCADTVARALTSPHGVVPGAFACMTTGQQNFWHSWAIARDDQLPDVVRYYGLTPGGLVDGYDAGARWTSAEYETDLEPYRHLYLVRSAEDSTARGLLVIVTDRRGQVISFRLVEYAL